MTFPVYVRTRWLDFSPALQWHATRKVESALQPFASRIRAVTVEIADSEGSLAGRTCVIQVVMHTRAFLSASATGAGIYESIEGAIARIRAIMRRRPGTAADSSGETRAA